jgi:hypothetical protein
MSAMGRAKFAAKIQAAARRKLELERRQKEVKTELRLLDEEVGQIMRKIDDETSNSFYDLFPDVVKLLGLEKGRPHHEVDVSPPTDENKSCDLLTEGTKDSKCDFPSVVEVDSAFLDDASTLEIPEIERAFMERLKGVNVAVDGARVAEFEYPEPPFDSHLVLPILQGDPNGVLKHCEDGAGVFGGADEAVIDRLPTERGSPRC